MLRKQLKRLLPEPGILKRHKNLRIFGKRLHSKNLWHINRQSIARAVAIGLFTCFLPMPFQMVVAAALAIFLYANLPLSVLLVWISNPITMSPMLYAAYRTGQFLLQLPRVEFHPEFSLQWLVSQLEQLWYPILIGCLVLGLLTGFIGYYATHVLWRLWIIHQWNRRSCLRKSQKSD
ncbi:MAG: ATP-binding protein [Gammaproteobacteria bacterium]|nr:ATP-binding protein [Gammaproteobacteria bacterium]